MNEKKLLTVVEVCRYLNLKESKVRSMVSRKELNPIRIGRLLRFKREEIESILKGGIPSVSIKVESLDIYSREGNREAGDK